MSANIASLVNQQLYHCELLLKQLDQLDQQSFDFRASYQALLNAALYASFLAYRGFLQELAESCQLQIRPTVLAELVQALEHESRSHACVANLQSLIDQPDSWLQQLLNAEQQLFEQAPSQRKAAANPQLIALSVNRSIDAPEISALNQTLKQFIALQREFLQEW